MSRIAAGLILLLLAIVWWPGGTQALNKPKTIFGIPGVQISADGAWLTDTRGSIPRRQKNFSYQASFAPNDPQYSYQWHFPAINLPSAWDADTTAPLYGGDPNIVVAVLDTGLAYEAHLSFLAAPDLATTTIWTNPGEVADGLDNDGNNLIDDQHGWDFVNNDGHPNDDHGHGTHVTGTVAGSTNNGLALTGIAFNTTIMPIKVLAASGGGLTSTITAGIEYAVAKGADIINLSLGGNDSDEVLHQAIIEAVNQGVVVVAAVGNNTGGPVTYPAKYPETIAVGATQYDRALAPYSNIGPEVDIVAPGGNLNLDQNNDANPDGILQQTCTSSACNVFQSIWFEGTSQATAHVTGVAALLEACGVPSASVSTVLRSSATDLGPVGTDSSFGDGLLNAIGALSYGACQSSGVIGPSGLTATASAGVTRTVRQHVPQPFDQPRWQWSGPAGTFYEVSWGKTSQPPATQTGTVTSFTATITSEGSYRLTVTAIDSLGRRSTSQTFTYRYRRPVLLVGQTSSTHGVRLYTNSLAFIRSWDAGLGTAVVHPVGGSIDQSGTSRILVTGQAAGRSIKLKTTQGGTTLNVVPFGNTYAGSIDGAFLERLNQQSVIVLSSRSTGSRLVWLSPGGTTIRKQTLYASYNGGIEIATGDTDGDGTDELITAMSNGHEIRTYDQTGLRLSVFSPFGKSFTRGFAITSGDADGDGDDEIVVAPRQMKDSTSVLMTTKNGVIVKSFRLRYTGYSGGIELVALDADGDGKDEVFAMTTSGSPRLLQLTSNGTVQKDVRPRTDGRGASLGGWQ